VLLKNRQKAISYHLGSLICRELLGCDISTPDGFQSAKERELFSTVYPRFVQDAAKIVEEMI
jgi:hypothetical protein